MDDVEAEDSQIPDVVSRLPKSISGPSQPDDLALSEELHLSPGKHLKLVHRQLITELRKQCDGHTARIAKLENTIEQLQDVRVENAKYHVTDRVSTLFFVVCSPVVLLGALFIETAKTDWVWGLGWGLLIIGLGVQFLMGLFNPRV